jgi:hypothetical protein
MLNKLKAVSIILVIVFIAGMGGELMVRYVLKGSLSEAVCEYVKEE